MTKPVTRKMVVDWFLATAQERGTPHWCMECGGSFSPGDDIQWDHRHADVHGGPHEYKNLWPLHRDCHKKKTAKDIAANAKVKRIQSGGRKRRGPKLKSAGFRKDLTKKMSGKVVSRGA